MSNKEGYPDPTAEIAISNVMREQASNVYRSSKKKTIHKKEGNMEQLKLKRVTRIDSIPVGSTYFNEQGFLHDTPIVTSTGIFEYALPDGGVRRELRLPEHVFEKESLTSYEGKPVIITHKAGSIDKTNVMDEIVGTILSPGYQDGSDVRCKIVIHDIDKVKAIPYRELSLGYSLDLIEEEGEWNGEHYDAIQTNIRINHLAIVETARAGEQAHLNLDGKKIELDDKQNSEEGGKSEMQIQNSHGDSIDITPEELIEAIKQFKGSGNEPEATPQPEANPEGTDGANVEPEDNGAEVPVPQPEAEPEVEVEATPVEPEVEKKDGNMDVVISTLEKLLAELKGGAGVAQATDSATEEGCVTEVPTVVEDNADNADNTDNDDSSEDQSQSMNNDSADDIIRQRLNICRIGDKLRMDGLENMSIIEGKKAIITKVLPSMRLDGKDKAYIDAAYDIAVGEVEKRKDVDYQRQQMTAGSSDRADSTDHVSMATSARQRMLEREGGNE